MQWRIQDFPEVGCQPFIGPPTYDFAKCSQKLNEIERIWTPRRACRSATGVCPQVKILTFSPAFTMTKFYDCRKEVLKLTIAIFRSVARNKALTEYCCCQPPFICKVCKHAFGFQLIVQICFLLGSGSAVGGRYFRYTHSL